MANKRTRRKSTPRWFLGIICLALAACGIAEPEPTLVPTLALIPTPLPTPSPVSIAVRPTDTPLAPDFSSPRTIILENNQSFDFRQETVGVPTQGDIYYIAFSARQAGACFWANNGKQVGGRDLGGGKLETFLAHPLPRDRYSGQCISVFRRHVYVYGLSDDMRLALFRVADSGPITVALEYILHE